MILALYLATQDGYCQFFLTGTDPGSVKWNQIKTPNFKVIYPRTHEEKGQYIANGLEHNYLHGGLTLNTLAPKTPVIVHPFTTVPSSVTYIAPRRMEFFTTPPQDIYPQDWTDQLIIHEFRHAVQYSAINKGFTRGLSFILGEQGVLGIFGLYFPMWFIEGDATAIETALHYTGRGRTPSFEMKLRSQIVDKGIYSYGKASYGSFKDFVPGKYELGYQLVGWSRVYFGKELWAGVMNNVGKRPYTLTAFSSSLKKQTGLNKYQLYDTVTTRMRRNWINEDKSIKENPYEIISDHRNKFYTNYNLPVIFRDSLVVAVKSSPDHLTKVVLLNQRGKEKELFKVGANYYQESLSANDSMIYWSEIVNDPRWFMRDYRVIKTYSFNSGKTGQLTHMSRYFAPAISNSGKDLVVVEVDSHNRYSLVILNASDGSVKKQFNTPDNHLFIHPGWSGDDSKIVSVVFSKNGNSLAITDTATGNTEILLPWTFMEMKRPSFYGNYIIYTASYDGRDNIYAFDRSSGEISRITSSRFGASDAFVAGKYNLIIYSDYTADGHRILKEGIDETGWKKITIPEKSAFPLAELLTEQEDFIFNSDSVPRFNYPSKPYRKLSNKFNIHSWAPVGIDLQNVTATPGVVLFSQNLLGTTVVSAGYQHNLNENTNKIFLNISDESLYPAFDLNIDYGNRRDTGLYTSNETIPEKWNEFNISPGIRLPLYWTKGPWIRKFKPSIGLNFKFLEMAEGIPVQFEDTRIIAPSYSLIASNELKTSYRDLYPRWSQEIRLNFNNTPFGDNYNSILACQAEIDFPGLVRHHGIKLYGAYQRRKAETYPFQDYIAFPRGYTEIDRSEITSYSVLYSLPLFYPDRQIKNIAYFKRLKASLFYDFAKSTDDQKPDFFSSAGIDLTMDFNLFNIMIPFDAGVRMFYLIESRKAGLEFLISLNIGGMY